MLTGFFKKFNFAHRSSFGPLFFIIFIGALAFALSQGSSRWWLYSYLIHFAIFTFGVGFGLHRIIAHQAADPPKIVQRFAALIGVLAQVGSPVSWRTVHLLHHAHSDRDRDPHSPSQLGWRVILGATTPPAKESIIESLLAARTLRDPFFIFLHKYYYVITAVYWTTCFSFFGVMGLVYLAIIPTGLSFLSLGFLNYFAHSAFGYQNFATNDRSRNIWWLWPLTFGENWHNNHHQAPGSSSTSTKNFEIDFISIYFVITKLF